MSSINQIEKLKQLIKEKDQLLFTSKVDLVKEYIKKYGNDAIEVIKKLEAKYAFDWAASVSKEDLSNGKDNNIDGLINMLWKPMKEEGFEYTYEINDGEYKFTVSKCPLADMAREMDMPDWGFLLYCAADYPITEGYNKDIQFTRTKTLMEGHNCCDHCYKLKKA